MKKFVIAAAAMVLVAGCSSAQKKNAQNNPPPPTPEQKAVTDLGNDRQDFVNRTQARIDEMSRFSAQLRTKADTTANPQKKKLSNAADDMDSDLKDVANSLNEVKQAAPQDWLDYKRDVTKSMQQAETQYSNSIRLLQ